LPFAFVRLLLCLAANNQRRDALCFLIIRPSIRPLSVRPLTPISCDGDISVLSVGISMKLATNIPHVSGHWWKDFDYQR